MIGKISGRLDWRGSDTVLIDVRGVGYIVHVSERTLAALPGVGEAVALYTELVVREDLLVLAEGTKAVAEGDLSPRPIVASSDEESEMQEVYNKLLALNKALDLAETI